MILHQAKVAASWLAPDLELAVFLLVGYSFGRLVAQMPEILGGLFLPLLTVVVKVFKMSVQLDQCLNTYF